MSKIYFAHDSKGNIIPSDSRPNNQSSRRVQVKSAKKQENTTPKNLRRNSANIFISDVGKNKKLSAMNGGHGVDMSHVISAHELASGLSSVMTEYINEKDKKKRTLIKKRVDNAVTDMLSSDDEDGDLDKTRALASDIFQVNGTVDLSAASKVVARMNRSSRNLFGGDASTNRKIGYRRDIPTDKHSNIIGYVLKRLNSFTKYIWGGATPAEYNPLQVKGKPISSTS